MSTLAQTSAPPGSRDCRRTAGTAARVGRDPLPERGREHRVVRDAPRWRRSGGWACAARWSSPTTTPRTTPRAWPSRRARAWWSNAARLRQRLPGRLRRLARPLHRDGRRRPDLRLRRDPALRRGAGGRRRDGDRRPHGQHPAGRDAVASPVHRQPDPHGPAQPVLPHRHQRRALRHARAAPRRAAAPGPAHDRHGVRLGDGHQGLQGEAAGSPSSRSNTTRAAARASCRASATAGATCASCSCTAPTTCSSCPARVLAGLGDADRRARRRRPGLLRARLGECTR